MPLSPGGQILVTVARVLGARVTSDLRSPAENEAVGGSPTSKHLTGDAVDIGTDAPQLALSVLSVLGTGGLHKKGTREHYHFEAAPWTVPLFVGGLVAAAMLVQRHGQKG